MSTHTITLFKTQTSKKSTYLSHDCSQYFFYCIDRTVPCGHTGGITDPTVGSHSCGLGCFPQNVCLKPDRSEAYIGLSSKGVDPLIHLTWDTTAPNLKCVYEVRHVDTPAQINNLIKLFPTQQIDHFMRDFCIQKVDKNCAGNRRECSRLAAIDNGGLLCREWLDKLHPPEVKDSVKREYCLHYNTADCGCINRDKSPDFDKYKLDAETKLSAHCWYKPCVNNDNLLLDEENRKECKANICQSIIEAQANGNIDISDNLSSLNCNFTGEQLKKASIEPPPHPVVAKYNNVVQWISERQMSVIGISIVIVIAVVVIAVVMMYSRKKN